MKSPVPPLFFFYLVKKLIFRVLIKENWDWFQLSWGNHPQLFSVLTKRQIGICSSPAGWNNHYIKGCSPFCGTFYTPTAFQDVTKNWKLLPRKTKQQRTAEREFLLFLKGTVSAGYLVIIYLYIVHTTFLQKKQNKTSFTTSWLNAVVCSLQHTNRSGENLSTPMFMLTN